MCDSLSAKATLATLRRVNPARPVLIDVHMILGSPDDAFRLDTVPLSVKTFGLKVFTTDNPGLLHAWAQTTRRTWLAHVSFEISTGDGRAQLSVCQWCPAQAVTALDPCRARPSSAILRPGHR